MRKAHNPRSDRCIIRLDPRDGDSRLQFDTGPRLSRRLVEALEQSSRESLWILPNAMTVSSLLDAVQELLQRHGLPKHRLGSLLLLEATRPGIAPVLYGLFERVVGATASFKRLPHDDLLDVLTTPGDSARDLFIGGWVHAERELLVLVRGDLQTLVAPSSMFAATKHARPDIRKLAFSDHGHTVRLGSYEASSDSILYDLDPDYRRRLNARRRAAERGFGPALRRLRKQRGLSRADFPGLSEKTLARIERGEIKNPHPRTMKALELKLAMTKAEMASF